MKKLLFITLLISIQSFCQDFDYKNYNQFVSKYVSEKGNVSYDKIKANKPELEAIILQFEKNQPTDKWSKNEKMAYYINVYNAFTIKTIIDNYPTKSIRSIPNVWDKRFILSGKEKISLGDVENKILRKMGDPRIHFAINCASFSCPKLNNEVFLPETLDKQLDIAAKAFVNDKSKNIITEDEIKVSEIFNWFAVDFKNTGSIIDYLNKYSAVKINKEAKITYINYNWSLNKG